MTPRPNPRRALFGVAGLALISVVLVAGGRVASAVPTGRLVRTFGNDYLLAAVLGGVALLVASVVTARGDTVVQSEMPDPEDGVSVPSPGDGLARTLDRRRLAVPLLARRTRRSVRERLRESAVAALVRAENCTERAARERIRSGRWTDDPDAAAFLADSGGLPPLGAYRRAFAAGDPWFVHGARRTADAIVRLTGDASGGTPFGDGTEGAPR